MNVEVIARASNTSIYRRAFDGRNWGSWAVLPSLDGDQIDARSDLDCSASADTVHVVASGIDPIGALEHAFGFGTSYNRFERELSPRVVPQSPAVALLSNTAHYFAAAGAGQPPQVFYVAAGSAALELTPITGLTKDLVSAADISPQLNGVYLAAFDADGKVAIHHLNMSSGGPVWVDAATIESPGFFSFSPTVCAETGLSGASSINVAAVTGHNLWFARTETAPGWPQFSTWGMVNTEADSSPDCVVLRENPSLDPIIHIVVLSTRGTVIDLVGNGTSWVTTDLGAPP